MENNSEEENAIYSFLDAKCEASNEENEWFEDYLVAEQDTRLKISTSNKSESSAVDNTEFIVAALKHLGIKNVTEKLSISESMKSPEKRDNDIEFDDLESLADDSVSDINDQINIEHGIPSVFVQMSIPNKGIYEGRLYLVEKLSKLNIDDNQRSNE